MLVTGILFDNLEVTGSQPWLEYLGTFLQFNPHMHEMFLQCYCMKWVPGDPLKEMIN